jgi:uncharacterized repeat protein (TIGR01451 family)
VCRKRLLVGLSISVVLGLAPLLTSSAAPLQQAYSLTLVSNQGQRTDQIPDRTLLQIAPLPLPYADWDSAYFNDSGWTDAFPVVRRVPWNTDMGGSIDLIVQAGADHIWGGAPSADFIADDGGVINYPPRSGNQGRPISLQTPQTLFLRKTFCIALDVNAGTISSSDLELMLATDFGPTAGAAFLNEWPINTNLPGDGQVHTYGLGAAPFQGGQNTLALWARDNRGDDAAAVLYRFTVNYDIDPNALTVAGPPEAHVGQPVTFSTDPTGLAGQRPLIFEWNMGDGNVISTGSTPSVGHAYTAPGTFTGVLTVTENGLLGCNAIQPFTITINTAALNVVKTDRIDPVAAGDFIDYDLTVQNTGAGTTFGDTIVSDPVPANTTFVACSGGIGCGETGGLVSWNVGPLASGAMTAVSLRVQVNNAPPPDPPVITNASYGASSGGGIIFNSTEVVTTTIIVLGTPTPTPTATPTATSTPTATPTSTGLPPTPTDTLAPPPPPTGAPVATAAPTTTVSVPTPAFLPASGQEGGRVGTGVWVSMLMVSLAFLWTWQRRRALE